MNKMYKYFFERKDTHEWYCYNYDGYYGTGYFGESFGNHPDPKNNWTIDPMQCLSFEDKNVAKVFLMSMEYFHDVHKKDIEITEHEFILKTCKCKHGIDCCSECLP